MPSAPGLCRKQREADKRGRTLEIKMIDAETASKI